MIQAKYVHTNLIAEDWRTLADFYQRLFGCIPVPPERDYSGEKLEAGTGIRGAHLRGVHLRLPGFGDNGPTLEIYQYDQREPRIKSLVNRPGFGHIAFSMDDVERGAGAGACGRRQSRGRGGDARNGNGCQGDVVLCD